MSKFNIQEATVQALTETLNEEHNIRPPYDRSKGQIEQIISLCKQYADKTSNSIDFDNTWSNHYKLIVNDKGFEFNTYRDVIKALNLMLL